MLFALFTCYLVHTAIVSYILCEFYLFFIGYDRKARYCCSLKLVDIIFEPVFCLLIKMLKVKKSFKIKKVG